ncbi:MAG: PEP-CTERM sorting domain-containing protein [Planctomycetes bacterium]|nr:PEP-CTERM sorting domain-containing protein [Planctomycetota bacterium]
MRFLTDPDLVVPEPSTFVLAALGLLSMGLVTRRRRRRA